MRELLILAIHLLVTFARLLRPGVCAVAAECLLLKHQLLVSNRSKQRAPNLTTLGRSVLFVRVHEIEEVKSIPYARVSHPFVERLIGTIRRECLDQTFFWNALDLARKLDEFRHY